MLPYVNVILTWILLLALAPMAYFWLRRAWRIFIRKDYSDVALKRGEPPTNLSLWAPIVGLLNLTTGLICLWVLLGVTCWIATGLLIGPFANYQSWTAIAGITIWGKLLADFIIRMQAHPFEFGRKRNAGTE